MGNRLVGALLAAVLAMAVVQMIQTFRTQDRMEALMSDDLRPRGYIGTRITYRGIPIEFRVVEEPGQTDAGLAQVFMNKLRAYRRQIDLDIAKNGSIEEK